MKTNRVTVIFISLLIGFGQGYVAADDARIKRETGMEVVQ